MDSTRLLGKEIRIFWSNPAEGKPASMTGIYHGSDRGQYIIEFDGSPILIPFTSVRYIIENRKDK